MKFTKMKIFKVIVLLLMWAMIISGCSNTAVQTQSTSGSAEAGAAQNADNGASANKNNTDASKKSNKNKKVSLKNLPAYAGDAYIAVNNNNPYFEKKDYTKKSFETYSELDSLGRCGVAFANVGQDLMPTKERGSISSVKPSGWQSEKYDIVDGKYLYNRCHLIGYQLTAENANKQNLITGTRYLNIDGMLPFENMVADYVKETKNHVLYRVTPVFDGDNLVAKGVLMEGFSVEDEGEGICFNVFAYNVQPGITIDYATGKGHLGEDTASAQTSADTSGVEIRANSHSMIYHCPGQTSYEDMANSQYLVVFSSEEEAVAAGYRKAKR